MTVSYHFAKVGFRQNTGTWYRLLHACNIVHTTTEDRMATNEVVVDERGRTSLARVRSHDYDRYLVEELPDGTLVLTPAVTVSALEMAALRSPEVLAAVADDKGAGDSTLKPHRRRSARRRQSSAASA
jgi:hypothetical protein